MICCTNEPNTHICTFCKRTLTNRLKYFPIYTFVNHSLVFSTFAISVFLIVFYFKIPLNFKLRTSRYKYMLHGIKKTINNTVIVKAIKILMLVKLYSIINNRSSSKNIYWVWLIQSTTYLLISVK